MELEKLLFNIVKILNNLKIKYFVTGGYAVSVWGRPRSTADIDIVVELFEPQIDSLFTALKKISKFGYLDKDVARYATKHNGEFNFIDPETGMKVDFWVAKKDKMSELKYKNRVIRKISNKNIYFISSEDLIISKLLWYKETLSDRHIEDVQSVIKISKINKSYLKKKMKELDLLDVYKKIKSN
jgi:hypothetical protein